MPGPPPPCGMQKVLWRLRWQTSAPKSPGRHSADLGVHVGAIHVDLAAVLVHDTADLPDARLEDAVGGGVGHHQAGERVPVLLRLGAQVREIDVPLLVGGDRHHREARHDRAGRIGSVRGHRDQAGAPMPLAPASMILADHQQAGVLALAPGIRLQRHRLKPVISASELSSWLKSCMVALGLRQRLERVQPVELPPARPASSRSSR